MRADTLWNYFQHSPMPLKVVSRHEDLVHHNAAFGRLLGYDSPQPIEARRAQDIVFPDDLGRLNQAYEQVFQGHREHAKAEARLMHQDGSLIWVQGLIVAAPTQASKSRENPIYALVICVDISRQKEVEQRIEQSERMRSLGLLASSVAHDFNNILTVLASYAGLLRADLESEECDKALGFLNKIDTAITNGVTLTRQLSDYGCESSAKVIDLNEHLQNTDSMLSGYFDQNFSIHYELAQGPAPIRVAPGKLDQILLNLALNALDAMPDGGEFVIRTRAVELQPGALNAHPSLSAGEYLVLEVCDDGEGIPFETQSQIFDPFFSTKTKAGGSGLGLAIVYSILEQLGGAIYVDSVPQQGTTFRLYFPRAELPAPPRPEQLN